MSKTAFVICMTVVGLMAWLVVALYISAKWQLPTPPETVIVPPGMHAAATPPQQVLVPQQFLAPCPLAPFNYPYIELEREA